MGARADRRRNGRLGLVLVGMVAGMVGLSFAAVPLYQIFCQVTGYGGTTQRAEVAPEAIGERVVTIRFNSDVAPGLPWAFEPVQRDLDVRVGESALAYYRAQNRGAGPVTGTATFNVTPLKAGQYFQKVECFCFTEQTLAPGQVVDMPVSFFIDPAIEDDRNLDEVRTITLSYTFFRDPDDETVRYDTRTLSSAGERPVNPVN